MTQIEAKQPFGPRDYELLRLLEQLDHLAVQIEDRLRQQLDTSLTDFEILEALSQRSLSQSQLCRRNNRTGSVVSRCVRRLTDKGYVASHPTKQDRRKRVASLLKRGVNRHQRIRAHLAGLLFQLAQELTPTLEARLLGLHQKFSHVAARLRAAESSEVVS